MTTETIFLVVSALVAGVILLAGLVALLTARRTGLLAPTLEPVGPGVVEREAPRDKYTALPVGAGPLLRLVPDRYRSALRAAWWATIVGVLIGIGLSDAYGEQQFQIFALGALAVATVVVFHELIPVNWLSRWTAVAEVLASTALLAGLIALSGWATSPFAPLLALPAVGVALGGRAIAGLATALLASATYVAVLATDPEAPFAATTLLAAGISLGTIWVVTILAVVFASQQRRLQATALQLSVTDPLTGLLNRAQIYVDLDQEVNRSRRSLRPFCLLMVDVDLLKRVNDTLGHERGDAAIRGISGVIRRSIRTVDSAYRYAGDEFMVLLPETEFSGAFVVAEKIRQGAEEVGSAFSTPDGVLSVSVGLVSHPEDGSTGEELMLAVDRAMYAAKAAGRNQVSGYPRPTRPEPGTAGAGAVSAAGLVG